MAEALVIAVAGLPEGEAEWLGPGVALGLAAGEAEGLALATGRQGLGAGPSSV